MSFKIRLVGCKTIRENMLQPLAERFSRLLLNLLSCSSTNISIEHQKKRNEIYKLYPDVYDNFRLRPSTNVQCQKYTEAEKYKLLEDAGGRNQLFMADSVDEASQNFAESYTPNPLGNTLGDAVFVAHFQQVWL